MEELGAGYCPWGHKELGTTERLHFTSLQVLTTRPSVFTGVPPASLFHVNQWQNVFLKGEIFQ